jgi:hypothetical protein
MFTLGTLDNLIHMTQALTCTVIDMTHADVHVSNK